MKRLIVALGFACAGLLSGELRSASFLPFGDGLERAAPEPAERYALPITPPLDQGDSDLCWVYAALSMLETNYLARHPGSHVELSRAALQRRHDRRPVHPPASAASRAGSRKAGFRSRRSTSSARRGLVARGDFHDVVESEPVFDTIRREARRALADVGGEAEGPGRRS